jgi:hypothetical protein
LYSAILVFKVVQSRESQTGKFGNVSTIGASVLVGALRIHCPLINAPPRAIQSASAVEGVSETSGVAVVDKGGSVVVVVSGGVIVDEVVEGGTLPVCSAGVMGIFVDVVVSKVLPPVLPVGVSATTTDPPATIT